MCLMVLLSNDFILIPSVDIFVADLKFDELFVELLQGRLIMLNSQGLIVHGRSVKS
jgi:hypothetical protein